MAAIGSGSGAERADRSPRRMSGGAHRSTSCCHTVEQPTGGRKNDSGSGALWSGRLAAVLFTLFQTLLKNELDPRRWLAAYFDACARNGGQAPEDVTAFLPWNLSDEQRTTFRLPQEQPP